MIFVRPDGLSGFNGFTTEARRVHEGFTKITKESQRATTYLMSLPFAVLTQGEHLEFGGYNTTTLEMGGKPVYACFEE